MQVPVSSCKGEVAPEISPTVLHGRPHRNEPFLPALPLACPAAPSASHSARVRVERRREQPASIPNPPTGGGWPTSLLFFCSWRNFPPFSHFFPLFFDTQLRPIESRFEKFLSDACASGRKRAGRWELCRTTAFVVFRGRTASMLDAPRLWGP